MNFSMTGQEKNAVLIQVTVFRGDHMGRFDYLEVTTWAGLTI
jgi:hypothetical protein